MAPRQQPGKSEQVVCTPPEFIQAVCKRLHTPHFELDLAASADNTVAPWFYTEQDDALTRTWLTAPGTWAWCNPPYADIAPWVSKACDEAFDGARIAMLVPASVGSVWWSTFVHDTAYVTMLRPRLTFVGHTTPYPKDLALLLYAPYLAGGYTTWRWK